MRLTPKPADVLPPDARNALIEASLVEPNKTESPRRIAAINKAAQYARLKYPQFFQPKE